VAVIGWKVYEELFGTRNAIGKQIDVSGQKVEVIGILEERGGGFSGAQDENNMVFMPVTSGIKITGIRQPQTILVRTTDAEGTTLGAEKVKNYFYRRNN